MHTDRRPDSRHHLAVLGFTPCSELRARLLLASRAAPVAVLDSWLESVPSGNSCVYATTLQEFPDGSVRPDNGWAGYGPRGTITALCELLDAQRARGHQGHALEWFERVSS